MAFSSAIDFNLGLLRNRRQQFGTLADIAPYPSLRGPPTTFEVCYMAILLMRQPRDRLSARPLTVSASGFQA